MKSSVNIRKLKIISINEGKQISSVKDIIVNSSEGSLAFFVIDQPSDYFGARIIAYSDILGLGDYALIIPDSSVIQDVAHNPLAIELLQKDVKVVGSQALTTKGCLVGKVNEIIIDEATGKIAACEIFTPEGTTSQVNCEKVITYGKEIVLIEDNQPVVKQAQPAVKQVHQVQHIVKQAIVQEEPPELNEKELLKKKIEQFNKSEDSLKTAVNSSFSVFSQEFNVFEQRQLQFLEGKVLDNDVQLDNGSVLRAGEQITAELLSAVKSRSTLMQMTVHVVK